MSETVIPPGNHPGDVPLPGAATVGRTADARGYFILKRVIDVIVAGVTLVLLLPLLLLIAGAIRIDSPGPAVFAQQRLGIRRVRDADMWRWQLVPFTFYKFRTMVVGADQAPHRDYMRAYVLGDVQTLESLRPGRRTGESFRPVNDGRVTRVGKLLRRTSLDELPQLWNVVCGSMSLVGPRPPVPYEVDHYHDERHFRRLASPAGITGLSQIRGRCSIGFEEMVRSDLEYVDRRSTWLDLKILLLTIPVVLSRKGAD